MARTISSGIMCARRKPKQDGERHSEGSELDHSSERRSSFGMVELSLDGSRIGSGQRSQVHPEGPSSRDEASPTHAIQAVVSAAMERANNPSGQYDLQYDLDTLDLA